MIKDVFIKSPYNYDMDKESELTGLMCMDETRAQQQFKDESDINTIVKRFGLTGELPDDFKAPVSGDFTNIMDFQSAMNAIRAAEESFMEMPAEMRARFNNDPQRLIEFLDNGDNRDEALKMGIIQKPPEKTRDMLDAIDEMNQNLKTYVERPVGSQEK